MIEFSDINLNSVVFTIVISLFVASPFLIASVISKEYRHPLRLRADLASFSAGIFMGAVTFSIIEEAIKLGDIYTLGFGFGFGAITFSITRYLLQTKFSSKSNNNSMDSNNFPNPQNLDNNIDNSTGSDIQKENKGSGRLIIIGTLADSHPETIMIGAMIALDIPGLFPTALTLFIGNFTATVVGTRELIAEAESKRKIIQKWSMVFVVVLIGGPIGYFLTLLLNEYYLSIIFSFAAGALMSFVTEELIPDAYRKVNWHIGLSACLGLFISFIIYQYY
jgi:ZIP family zinc transporter